MSYQQEILGAIFGTPCSCSLLPWLPVAVSQCPVASCCYWIDSCQKFSNIWTWSPIILSMATYCQCCISSHDWKI